MRIALLREAGGIGDVVRTGSVAKILHRRYENNGIDVVGVGLEQFSEVYRHLKYYDSFIPVRVNIAKERRPRSSRVDSRVYPYLSVVDFLGADKVVDLFCPAYAYEVRCKDVPDKSRSELFCEASGMKSLSGEDITPEWKISEGERAIAVNMLKRLDSSRPLIATQFRSTCNARSYPHEYIQEFYKIAQADGKFNFLHLDCMGISYPIPECVYKMTDQCLGVVAALLERLGRLIAIDSSMMHIAGALGVRTLGVYGPTCHSNIAKHYKNSYTIDQDLSSISCKFPCFYTSSKGWQGSCREAGCSVMKRNSPDILYQAVKEKLS